MKQIIFTEQHSAAIINMPLVCPCESCLITFKERFPISYQAIYSAWYNVSGKLNLTLIHVKNALLDNIIIFGS